MAGLGKGAIAGIVVGVLAALALAGAALAFLLQRHRRNRQVDCAILLSSVSLTFMWSQRIWTHVGISCNSADVALMWQPVIRILTPEDFQEQS